MNSFLHYGRRVPIPSTLQIVHELKVFGAEEDRLAQAALAAGAPAAAAGDIAPAAAAHL